ncbi:hypothetical protein, variant [Magnaporthiopsis poae ATCC 64411]|uniref:Gamma-glutamylcyclotransferase AIG2-like domain-containing protein n=1 Tax=Magnaporthiopsis poae (strain ATCC 64411 / 73-15) TaxID=644358 RepID=A0A0C4E9R9_MAGP6|nr:hypothetical protein, variant [Magnaporthiopsis poae ATCC 64411]
MDPSLLAACEALATNVLDDETNISDEDIVQWRRLFSLSHADARAAIQDWRSDLGRTTMSSESWESLQHLWPGHSKESYDYAMATGKLKASAARPNTSASGEAEGRYLLRLEPGFLDARKIQEICRLDNAPVLFSSSNDDDTSTEFCIVDARCKAMLLRHVGSHLLLFIRHSEAEKVLLPFCRYRTLGVPDCTMPQFRLPDDNDDEDDGLPRRPAQDEYPVWYFSYGRLAMPEVLGRVLHLRPDGDDGRVGGRDLYSAEAEGGKLATWGGGKYNALVHAGEPDTKVAGAAYRVKSQEEEAALRAYETDRREYPAGADATVSVSTYPMPNYVLHAYVQSSR